MPTLDANSLLSDPAPIWFDESVPGDAPGGLPFDPLQAALATLAAQVQRPALAVVPPPAADPLAQALPWLVRHLGVAAAVEAVVGPVDDEQPAASADVLPALRRIGFDAHLQRRSLDSFSKADLPTVLMLHNGDVCVLTARWQDEQGLMQCNLVLPGPQADEFTAAQAEIEAEYSGVALVVSRPARPPFAAALARARAASAGQTGAGPSSARPGAAADAAPMAHADALVALAAAVQGAHRAMHATRSEAATPAPQARAAAVPAPQARAAAVLAPQSRAAAAPAPQARAEAAPSPTGRQLLSAAAQPPAGFPDDDPAAVLKLSFMQPDKPAMTPGQALSRMAHDARALLRVTLAPLGQRAVTAACAVHRQACGAGRQLAGLARGLAGGLARVARQGALGPGMRAWRRLGRLALLARQHGLAWLQGRPQRQRHRRALPALGPASLDLSPTLPLAGSALPAPNVDARRLLVDALPASLQGVDPTASQAMHCLPPVAAPSALPAWPSGPLSADVSPAPQAAARAARSQIPSGLGFSRLGQRLVGVTAHHRLAHLTGLAGASALCLCVGAPQAWATMVSTTSLQALHATPRLLRSAFRADLEQAGLALAAEGLARLVAAKNRLDCELGQPMLAAADDAGLAAPLPRQAAARVARKTALQAAAPATGQRAEDGLAPASAQAVRGRGVPRRARHACR